MNSSRKPSITKRTIWKWHDFKDYWLRDKDGNVVIAQTPNIWLIIFMVSGIYAIVSYHGLWHGIAQFAALISITVWGYLEARSGVTRARRLMGRIALICILIVLILYLVP